MNRILLEAETHQQESGPRHVAVPRGELTDHITHGLCELADETGAEAIITPTITGRTARLVARHRPKPAIIAVSTHAEVVRQLGVVWGVAALSSLRRQGGDDRLEAAVRAAFLQSGASSRAHLVVVLASHPIEGGEGFPTIRVVRVGEEGRSCDAKIRNPNIEIRNKFEANANPEKKSPYRRLFRISSSNLFRISTFGFRIFFKLLAASGPALQAHRIPRFRSRYAANGLARTMSSSRRAGIGSVQQCGSARTVPA